MAFEIPVLDITLEASADLSADQFKLIQTDSSGQAALTGAGGVVTGILQDEPDAAGQGAAVRVYGVTKVKAGAAISVGDQIESDASGLAITTTTGYIIGIALEAASASGDIIPMLITHSGVA